MTATSALTADLQRAGPRSWRTTCGTGSTADAGAARARGSASTTARLDKERTAASWAPGATTGSPRRRSPGC